MWARALGKEVFASVKIGLGKRKSGGMRRTF